VISFVTIEHKKNRIFHWIFGRSKIFFLLLNFHSQVFNFDTNFLLCHHVDDMPHRIPPDNNLTPKAECSLTNTKKTHNTTKTQHDNIIEKKSSRPWQKQQVCQEGPHLRRPHLQSATNEMATMMPVTNESVKKPTTMPKAKRRWTTPHAKQAL
jgi:hypothetical protein